MSKETLLQLAERLNIKNLISVLNSDDLKQSIADIHNLDGWIRVTSSLPNVGELVLITNGTDVWMGDVGLNGRKEKEWSVVYDGSPCVRSHEVKAWQYLPTVPREILNPTLPC